MNDKSNENQPIPSGAEAVIQPNRYTDGVRDMIADDRFEQATKGFYSHQTHSKAGEHVLLSYNSHLDSDLAPEYFLQTYPPGRVHLRREAQLDSFRWSDAQGPEQLYPDKLDRIDSLLALFAPSAEELDAEA